MSINKIKGYTITIFINKDVNFILFNNKKFQNSQTIFTLTI